MSDHDHDRTFQPDHAEPTSDAARIGLALRELLIEAGYYTADEERQVIAAMQGASPENGAKIVARAWTDAGFKERLLGNGIEAIEELGFDLQPYEFTVMETRTAFTTSSSVLYVPVTRARCWACRRPGTSRAVIGRE